MRDSLHGPPKAIPGRIRCDPPLPPGALYLSHYEPGHCVLQTVCIHTGVGFFYSLHDLSCKVERQADAGLLAGIGDKVLVHGPGQ